ncbi:DUF1194 domain-containing protein [Leptolyngbya sp. PCC 6406]|uniref:DUF1194 domain-containing protein n=1 Tax=Leptolyngbya sp. PCC 6406 TaxID=1173264 RepID=UPI0002ABBA7E|nr:DUF1194 domain-containing protein [Leptolyngbya sp. PCC 6406]
MRPIVAFYQQQPNDTSNSDKPQPLPSIRLPRRKLLGVVSLVSGFMTLGAMFAQVAYSATLVGTKLVLSVDVSGSVDANEFAIQRNGYVAAFRNAEVIDRIENTPGGIAVAFSYWATTAATTIDWFHITDATTSNEFADLIAGAARPGTLGVPSVGPLTSIINAMGKASDLFANTSTFTTNRRVLDISGDGTNNSGGNLNTLAAARQNLLDQGVIINGLPILDSPSSTLDDYYTNNVIGGEGSFVEVAASFSDFEQAVLNKIKKEIVVLPPDPGPGTSVPEPGVTVALMLFGAATLSSVLRQA